jgi:ABC-type branched-subunit amino acid transport system substrate-binding protein
LVNQGGQLVLQETYPGETHDFTPALDRLLAATGLTSAEAPPFDALFIPDDAPTVAALAGQLAGSRLGRVQLLGTNLIHPSEAQETEARALEGILFPDGFFPGDPNAGVQNFLTAYRQKYGETPDYLAAQGYLMVKVMAKLLESPGPWSRSDLPQRLLALKSFPDLPWFQGFAPDRQADLALYILTIKDGQLQMAPSAR